jgi:hypothetical protein
MMFSSPAFALNDSVRQVDRSGGLGPILNESGVSEAAGGGDTATFESIADLVDDVDPDNSFSREHNTERRGSSRENNGLRNPDARSNSTVNFDALALRTLEEEQSHDQAGCNASRRRVLGRVAQDDPLRALEEVDLPTSPGFTVYEEEEEKTAFDVYRDPGGREASQGVESEGDTATLSLFGDALGALTEVAQGGSDAESVGSLTLELNERGGASSSRVSKSLGGNAPYRPSKTLTCLSFCFPATAMNADAPDTDDSVGFGDISRITRVEDTATKHQHFPP